MKQTKKSIDSFFIKEVMPEVRKMEAGRKDKPLRCETYNSYIDRLHREGSISDKQANSYCIPSYLI